MKTFNWTLIASWAFTLVAFCWSQHQVTVLLDATTSCTQHLQKANEAMKGANDALEAWLKTPVLANSGQVLTADSSSAVELPTVEQRTQADFKVQPLVASIPPPTSGTVQISSTGFLYVKGLDGWLINTTSEMFVEDGQTMAWLNIKDPDTGHRYAIRRLRDEEK